MNIPVFQAENDMLTRQKQSLRIKCMYPDRLPVIMDRATASVPPISKRKFLVPKDISFGELIYIIRRRLIIDLRPGDAIFVFIYGTRILPVCSRNMSEIYQEHSDRDGFLYLTYSKEYTFG